MLQEFSYERDLIAALLRSEIEALVGEHYGLTQEHQLTARIGERMTRPWTKVLDVRFRIVTQDIDDKGPRSLERKLGGDLYIGVEIETQNGRISKGFIIQAKWDKNLSRTDQTLVKQCGNMLGKTHAAYVWVYERQSVRVLPAVEIENNPNTSPLELGSKNLEELFMQVFDCFEGDREIGLPIPEGASASQIRAATKKMLKELSIPKGIAIQVMAQDRRAPE